MDINEVNTKAFYIKGFLEPIEGELLYKYATDKDIAVEIGSFKGKSSVYIASAIKEKVYCIDTFEGSINEKQTVEEDTYDCFLENTKWFDKIQVLKMTSLEASKKVQEEIDLLFIDGGHNEEDIKIDTENWIPKLKINGVLIMHDVFDWDGTERIIQWPAVYNKYQELLESGQFKLLEKAQRSACLLKVCNVYK